MWALISEYCHWCELELRDLIGFIPSCDSLTEKSFGFIAALRNAMCGISLALFRRCDDITKSVPNYDPAPSRCYMCVSGSGLCCAVVFVVASCLCQALDVECKLV